MFIFNLNYTKPLSEVERLLPEHIKFLDRYYQKNRFLCSGRKVPRTGGVILCTCSSRQEAEQIMQEDPFYQENIAHYDILEFIPSKASEAFRACIN